MKKPNITIMQDEKENIPLEILATHVRAISEGIKRLRNGPISDRALIILVQHASPSVSGRFSSAPIPAKTIRAVIEGIENLERFVLCSKDVSKK